MGLPCSYVVLHACSSLVYGTAPALIGPSVAAFLVLSGVSMIAALVPIYRAGSVVAQEVLRDS